MNSASSAFFPLLHAEILLNIIMFKNHNKLMLKISITLLNVKKKKKTFNNPKAGLSTNNILKLEYRSEFFI